MHYVESNGVERIQHMRIQYNKTVQIINRQEYEKTNLKETAQISANFLAKLSKNKPCQIRHPYENCRGT